MTARQPVMAISKAVKEEPERVDSGRKGGKPVRKTLTRRETVGEAEISGTTSTLDMPCRRTVSEEESGADTKPW